MNWSAATLNELPPVPFISSIPVIEPLLLTVTPHFPSRPLMDDVLVAIDVVCPETVVDNVLTVDATALTALARAVDSVEIAAVLVPTVAVSVVIWSARAVSAVALADASCDKAALVAGPVGPVLLKAAVKVVIWSAKALSAAARAVDSVVSSACVTAPEPAVA